MFLVLLACSGRLTDLRFDTGGVPDKFETGVAAPPACLGEAERQVLEDWLYQMWLVAYGAPGSATASSVASFYQLPGVARTAWFSLGLSAPCASVNDRDPVCANGVCYQVECTGSGGSWVNHIQNDGDVAEKDVTDFDGWTVERGRLPLAWNEGAAVLALEIDVKSLVSPEGMDWTVSGTGILDGALDLSASFPALYDGLSTKVEITADAGVVLIDDYEVAVWEKQVLRHVEACE